MKFTIKFLRNIFYQKEGPINGLYFTGYMYIESSYWNEEERFWICMCYLKTRVRNFSDFRFSYAFYYVSSYSIFDKDLRKDVTKLLLKVLR